MGISEKNSIERTFLSKERNALSEERTVLAYITTELAVVGVITLILRFYFAEFMWSIPIATVLFVIFGILIIFETSKIQNLRKKRHKLQKKHIRFKL